MKISHTPDLLIIDNTPWLFGIILMAAVFGAIVSGLFLLVTGDGITALWHVPLVAFLMIFVWAFVRRNQLLLDARARTVTHRRRTIFSHTEVIHDLSHLAETFVEESRGKNGPTYRMTLRLGAGMDRGDHPFTMAYTSGPGARRASNAVNDWLRDRRS